MIQNISPSADSFLTAINQLQAQVQRAQEEIGSGLRVNRPSDDPSVVTDILQINSSLARNTQIGQNLSNVTAEVNGAEQALSSAVSTLDIVATLGSQGANFNRTAADRQPTLIGDLLGSPLYRFDAWLRDESSYSRWERPRLVDLATGQAIDLASPLPNDFRLDVALRRPEAAAHVWLLGPTEGRQEGLELDRDRRNARWVIQRESGGNASAVNASSGAGGLYGFLPSTWQALGHSGLPENASVAEQNAAFAQEYAQSGGSAWSG